MESTQINQIEVSIFSSMGEPGKPTNKPLASIINAMQSDKWQDKIENVRACKRALQQSPKDAELKARHEASKKKLPCFTASGTFSRRAAKNLIAHSGLIQLDLDGKDNPDWSVEDMREIVEADPHTRFAAISPSGDGIKALIRIPANPDTHLASYKALEKLYASHGLAVDQSCKDLSRAFFVTYDPQLFQRDFGDTLELQPLRETKPAKREYKITRDYSSELSPDDEAAKCLDCLDPDMDYGDWLNTGMAAHSHGASCATWDAWSSRGSKYKQGEPERKWNGFNGDGVKFGSLVHMATEANGGVNPLFDDARTRVHVDVNKEFQNLAEESAKVEKNDLHSFIASRRFDELVVPEHQEPLVGLNNTGVIWKGNIHTLVAPSKAGKTAAMAAMMRTLCTGERHLGWTAEKLQGKIVYLDFEQDAEDFYNVLAVQARVTSGEVAAYRLAGLDPIKAQQATELILEDTPDASMVMLDGYADLIINVNDTEESNNLAARWMDMTERHNVALLGVLHLNPSSDSKSRGHLGSQLERKSKTVLKIDVAKDGTRETYTQYARKAFIPQGHGVSWKWDDSERGFIELTETKAERREVEKLEVMTAKFDNFIALTMFSKWTFTDLKGDITEKLEVSQPTATNYIKYWSDNNLLKKTQNVYSYEPF